MTKESLHLDFALDAPRIAVAGFNPHAGEEGLFGDEEARIVAPAVAAFADEAVSGPWPPDTVFHKAAAGAFDAVIALYHDQGLIPFKLLHFQDGVNVTLGLPLVRTSVDHGTAYDIAGKNLADPSSLAAALGMAHAIAANRQRGAMP
jgi:4-hydroxythreonine-4-phosphate dehydrogenase